MKTHSIAVVGNPNCGKSTVFNGLTGSNQQIGNWPGVTVEKKTGMLAGSKDIEVVDLPGIYSLNSGSEDELIARNHVLSGDTDLVVNIADASNLERNLFLTMTLLEMGKPMILVLSMKDMAEKQGVGINTGTLSMELGIPVIAINALSGPDIRDLRRLVAETLQSPKESRSPVCYPNALEELIISWSSKLKNHPRQSALMLLEEDEECHEQVIRAELLSSREIREGIEGIEKNLKDTPDVIIAEAKFSSINQILEKVLSKKRGITAATEKIDRIVLNKWAGIPIFMVIMYLLFWTVIHIGGAFIDFFDIFFGAVFVDGFGMVLEVLRMPDWFIILLAGGVGAGIQTVATFIPIVFFMFLMLSLLEDSGYMARAAFVMDRFMRMLGLPGKAFVSMLVGFGCTVPAVMATRTLENKKDRYLTVFMAPFMSCGARLPVYALFGAAFFGTRSGIVVFAIYLSGILLAVITGLILKGTLFKGEASHFVMELPPYHMPNFRMMMKRTWNRLKVFILRAGKVIITAVLVLAFFNSMGADGSFGNEDNKNSVLAVAGESISPIFTPMGIEKDNWPATVGLLTGLFAKEAIVGTMTGLYSQMAAAEAIAVGAEPEDTGFSFTQAILEALRSIPEGLSKVLFALADPFGISFIDEGDDVIAQQIGAETTTFGQLRASFGNDWTRAFAYLLFVLIYFPCLAAFGAIVREIGAGYGWLAMVYLTMLAWSVATVFFQIATGHNLFWIVFAAGLVALFIPVFNLISGRWRIFGRGRNPFEAERIQ